MKDFFVPKDLLLFSDSMRMNPDFSVRGFNGGQAEAIATLTITVSGTYEFYDDFTTFDTSSWQQYGLASVAAVSGKLVVTPATYTYGQSESNNVRFIAAALPTDWELETTMSWAGTTSAMGSACVYIKTTSGNGRFGISDGKTAYNPTFVAGLLGSSANPGGQYGAPTSGTMAMRIVKQGSTMYFYKDDALVLTASLGTDEVLWIGLAADRYNDYAANVPSFHDFSLIAI